MDHGQEARAFAKRLGVHLKRLRTAAGLTQPEVAERLGAGTAVETVSRYERGVIMPNLERLAELAAIYGSTLDAVYAGALATPPEPDPTRRALHDLVARLDAKQVAFVRGVVEAYLASEGGAAPDP